MSYLSREIHGISEYIAMAVHQGVKSFHAKNLEISLYWTLWCLQEISTNNSLLSDRHRRCKIAITEKWARIKQTPDAAEYDEFFAIPVYRLKQFSMECREKK